MSRRVADLAESAGAAQPELSPAWIADVAGQLAAGEAVRRDFGAGGRLHIDRPLPFLCVYRTPADRDDPGTREFVVSEASFLIMPAAHGSAAAAMRRATARLVEAIVAALAPRFAGFLVAEAWAADLAEVRAAGSESELDPTELRPAFRIGAGGGQAPMRTIQALQQRLERIAYLRQPARAEVDLQAAPHPPGMPALLSGARRKSLGCDVIGLEVRPVYRSGQTGELYPAVLRKLRHGVGRALKQALFTYSKTRTTARPEHFYSLGRRALVRGVKAVDRILSEVSDGFQFLLQVTPVNGEAAWREFRRCRFEANPRFYYRPLAIEPGALKRRLYSAPIEDIEDPTLSELFLQRQDELDRKLTMLTDVGTWRFRLGSLQVYGRVETSLLELAGQLLHKLPSRGRAEAASGQATTAEFAERAREEIAYYRRKFAGFAAEVVVRDDLFSGLLCSGGNLIIGQNSRTPRLRVEALLQHEVGTHLVTYYNGLAQPFQLLHAGLAGYESLQEGLAVLSEHLVGGLTPLRLRLLAARVVAAHMMIEGASFIETFRKLDRDYDFDQRTAYTVAMRTYRGGGLTKDAVYLRGLVEVLNYVAQGGELTPLFVGKIAVDHIEFVRELQHRRVLKPPAVLPRYLEMPGVAERLAALRAHASVFSLIED